MNLTERQPASKSDYISVVVPAYNEAASLPGLMSRLDDVFDAIGKPYELLVVDDGSTDTTEAFALSLTYQFMVCFEVFKKHFTPHFRANLSSCESIVSYI